MADSSIVLQRARFDLRDIDWGLFLVDAALHAIIANTVACASTHWVINGDDSERA